MRRCRGAGPGRAKLLLSRTSAPGIRLGRSLALPSVLPVRARLSGASPSQFPDMSLLTPSQFVDLTLIRPILWPLDQSATYGVPSHVFPFFPRIVVRFVSVCPNDPDRCREAGKSMILARTAIHGRYSPKAMVAPSFTAGPECDESRRQPPIPLPPPAAVGWGG